jgi:hypothetical protein
MGIDAILLVDSVVYVGGEGRYVVMIPVAFPLAVAVCVVLLQRELRLNDRLGVSTDCQGRFTRLSNILLTRYILCQNFIPPY